MQVPRRYLMWGAGGVALAAILALALRPERLDVEWGLVERGPMRVTVEAEAETRSRMRYVITAPITGRVERLRLEVGDSVHAGMVIARIAAAPLDPRQAEEAAARVTAGEAAWREASARLAQARSNSARAARDADRARAVETVGGLALQARENADLAAQAARDELVAAEARLALAEAEVRAARATLESGIVRAIRAPANGRVLRVPEISERVSPAGAPLLEMADPRDLEVVADLLSADAARVVPGALVELRGWGSDTAIVGRVRLVEPVATTRVSALGVDEQRVNVVIEPPEHVPPLGHGYRLSAHIVLWRGDHVLHAPTSALFRSGTDWSLYAVEGGRARLRTVGVGHRSDVDVEIRDGVAAGDTVILFASDRVKNGTRVRLAN